MKKKYNHDDNTIDGYGNVFRSEIRGYILRHGPAQRTSAAAVVAVARKKKPNIYTGIKNRIYC